MRWYEQDTRKKTWFALGMFSVILLLGEVVTLTTTQIVITLDATVIAAIAAGYALILTPGVVKRVKEGQVQNGASASKTE